MMPMEGMMNILVVEDEDSVASMFSDVLVRRLRQVNALKQAK